MSAAQRSSPTSAVSAGPGDRERDPVCGLILDVHPLFSRMLRSALRDEGMAVHEVTVGGQQEMVDAVARHGSGVVLLELALARHRDGVRAGPLVAALTAIGHPVLGVRGHGDDAAAAAASGAGAVGVVSKHLPLPDLVHAMVRAGSRVPVGGR